MKTDRELLELAAKAAGYSVEIDMNWGTGGMPFYRLSGQKWDPLTDDGDALRLMVKLRMNVYNPPGSHSSASACCGDFVSYFNEHGSDEAATRRAIVRAAAAIGAEA